MPLIGRAAREISFNQSEADSDLGRQTSSVWNFCARFSDVISRGNQWLRREMSAVSTQDTLINSERDSLRSKRFNRGYCAKVRAEAKKG